MMKLIIYIVFNLVAWFTENMVCYAIIRKIDKNERVKINNFENNHAEELKQELELDKKKTSKKVVVINDNN